MKLSKDVWLLWGTRILAANILLYPGADSIKDNFKATMPLLLSVDLIMIIFLTFRFISLRLSLEGKHLHITRGIILRRVVCIKPNCVYAVKRYTTPLCRIFRLSYMVIYCEGKRFMLPPLKNDVSAYIEKELKSR